MFRLTKLLEEIKNPTPVRPQRDLPGPVVIWNLVRRCNLKCKHCYAISGDVDFPGELNTDEVCKVMDELRGFRVPVLILSGGEPLLRSDIYDISRRAKKQGFYVGLSTNGTLIDESNIEEIDSIGYDYVGISLDGIGETHDKFRMMDGAYEKSLHAMRLCRDRGLKVGARFTMTADNESELPEMLRLIDEEGFDKFYFSHLVYAGRGNKNRGDDAERDMTRRTMELLFETAWDYVGTDTGKEFVTGNNDADGVFLYYWVKEHFPEHADHIHAKLVQWGGNASGVNVANIDNLGNVHPDTMWWHHTIGNVKETNFSKIWSDRSDPIMAGLKQRPRKISGRCGACMHFDICNGNTRVRALKLTGDAFAEDPACYLFDEEIGLTDGGKRLEVTPFRGAKYEKV
ncbi:MAG: heme d1 biosynthesis radical SAM protein NirJ [bacterium]|nr:heme d1 biosynthesis radical SAM protein NirJ [bacterium]